MKIKNKGKVYPSPPPDGDYLSVLKLLPAAILALASVLSVQDREVLAYLITRSIKTTSAAAAATNSSSVIQRKASKKAAADGTVNISHQKPPVFDCDCFDCYTSYWFRWDSSPSRELIHQAIEAFEDPLTNAESSNTNKKKYGKSKRRDKTSRRLSDKNNNNNNNNKRRVEETVKSSVAVEILPENDVAVATVSYPEGNEVVLQVSDTSTPAVAAEETAPVFSSPPPAAGLSSCSQHKGLARKALPDVLGLFNSRLWSLWSPDA